MTTKKKAGRPKGISTPLGRWVECTSCSKRSRESAVVPVDEKGNYTLGGTPNASWKCPKCGGRVKLVAGPNADKSWADSKEHKAYMKSPERAKKMAARAKAKKAALKG